VPCVLCPEQGTTSKALLGGSGELWGQGETAGTPHPPGTPTPWGPSRERGLGTATVDAAPRVPSLPACDEQDLKPEPDSS